MKNQTGQLIYDFAKKLFPLCRSITGQGVRDTLVHIKNILPGLKVYEVPSGEKCFDWIVPCEWNIHDAYIIDPTGKKIIDFHQSNLHVVNYSIPVDQIISLDDLQAHLYSLPDQPDAIPYITSYYKQRWGFCLSHHQREQLIPGNYRVFIDATLVSGSLSYGELILAGDSKEEILLSTYICHPSLANDNLSGICVTTYLAAWLNELAQRKYSYRIIFIPETIGSIVYLSKHLNHLKTNLRAGFNITCIGDERSYTYLTSRNENTLADKVAHHVFKHTDPYFSKYSFLERGSDERQFCSPGVDLPVVTVMRSKFDTYPEYHTSLDDLTVITPMGLAGGFEAIKRCIECIENNEVLTTTVLCEPQLGKRGLYPHLSTKDSFRNVQMLANLLAYCDGKHSLLEIAEKINVPMWELFSLVERLKKEKLLINDINTPVPHYGT